MTAPMDAACPRCGGDGLAACDSSEAFPCGTCKSTGKASSKTAAPTDAPVEERHRRAAVDATAFMFDAAKRPVMDEWVFLGSVPWGPVPHPLPVLVAQALAYIERDGRASRDAEVAELSAYRRAWDRWLELSAPFARNAGERVLAEELARKGTP